MHVRTAALRQRLAQSLTVPGVDRVVKAPVKVVQPKVTTAQLAKKYPVVLVADRTNFKLRLYKDLKLEKEYTVAVGAVGFDTPAGLYHIQNKAVNPAWTVPNSDWAGDLAGRVVPGGSPDNPLKARWIGHLRRRRHPRHRADLLARQRRLARLHPDGDPRRDRALRPGPGRRADLHRLNADLRDRHFLPAPLLQGGLAAGVSNAERADEDAPLALAQHRVPHRRGVAGPLDSVPRRQRLVELVHQVRLGELSSRCDPTVLRVDEEDAHGARG